MTLEDLKTYKPGLIGEDRFRQASVLIPLLEEGGDLSILFQVRSARLRNQPGDICFPGGRREAGESLQETALREACEELLITPKQIRILGQSDRYAAHGRSISAFVGELMDYQGSYSRDEVEEVFTVPLSFFMKTPPDRYVLGADLTFPDDFPFDKIRGGRDYPWHARSEEILFWEYEGRVIWGLTACLLDGFLRLL